MEIRSSEAALLSYRLAAIRLLVLDVDGVLTDGRFYLTGRGEEYKAFDSKDGHGLRMLMQGGVRVLLISGRTSKAVDLRARELGVAGVHQGVKDKESLLRDILAQERVKKEEVCCVGDDLPDLPLFSHVGVSVAVADAVPELRHAATLSTRSRGGAGAVREVCELILKAKGLWPYAPFSSTE